MLRRHFIFATLIALATVQPVRADDDDDDRDDDDDDDGDDQDEVLRAVEDRQILPLEALLRRFAEQVEGRVVDVRLEKRNKAPAFRVTYVAPDGRVRRAVLDAANGNLLD